MADYMAIGREFVPQFKGYVSKLSSKFINKSAVEQLNLRGIKYVPDSGATLKLAEKPMLSAEDAIKQISKNEATSIVKQPKYTSSAKPFKQSSNHHGCNVYKEDGTLLGKCSYQDRVVENSFSNDTFPSSWIDSTTNKPKSSLYVHYIDTQAAGQNKGNGREIMKRLYLQSVENGHGGRISLQAAWDSPGFYEKLGFENNPKVIETEKKVLKNLESRLKYFDFYGGDYEQCYATKEELLADVLKQRKLVEHVPCQQGDLYFTPTEENLAKLFAK